jgi:hypothetical protein
MKDKDFNEVIISMMTGLINCEIRVRFSPTLDLMSIIDTNDFSHGSLNFHASENPCFLEWFNKANESMYCRFNAPSTSCVIRNATRKQGQQIVFSKGWLVVPSAFDCNTQLRFRKGGFFSIDRNELWDSSQELNTMTNLTSLDKIAVSGKTYTGYTNGVAYIAEPNSHNLCGDDTFQCKCKCSEPAPGTGDTIILTYIPKTGYVKSGNTQVRYNLQLLNLLRKKWNKTTL